MSRLRVTAPRTPRRAPRYTGLRTFARCPHVTDPEGVDVAVVGVPFDTATSYRAGRALRPGGDPGRLDAAAPLPPGARRRRVRAAVGGGLGRPRHHARQRRAHAGPDRRRPRAADRGGRDADRARRRPLDRARRAARPGGRPRPGGARAARRARRHLGPATTASATSTARRSAARSRRACCCPSARCMAGMRGPLYVRRRPRRGARPRLRAGRRARSCGACRRRSTARACASASATRPPSSASTST